MKQLTGKADIYVNGSYAATSQEGATLSNVAGRENTVVMNSQGKSAGYTSKAVPATIKASFLHYSDFDISTWTGDSLSVVFACDNGPQYQIADAVFLKAEDLDASKGTITISFGGDVANVS